MKFTIDRTTLLKTLSHTQSVVERRNTIPVLANVLLEAQPGMLRITATDMEITISDIIHTTIDREGYVTAPAGTLYDIAKRLPDDASVSFDHEPGQPLHIKAGRFKTDLSVLPAEDFPETMGGAMPHRFELPCQVLRQALERVRFAISNEETRYYLTGIYLHVPDGGDKLRAVATDGHRLGKVTMEAPQGAQAMPGVIVPRKTVAELLRLVGDSEGDVALAFSMEKMQAQMGEATLTSRLIDGTFPDYERVIPQGNDRIIRIETGALRSAVDRCAAVTSEKSKPLKMSVAPDAFTVMGQGDRGQAQEELVSEAFQYDGDAFEIGFNTKYVNDLLAQMGEYTEMRVKDGQSPVLLAEPDDDTALYLLMPMRV